MRGIAGIVALILWYRPLAAQSTEALPPDAEAIYRQIFSLRLSDANQRLQALPPQAIPAPVAALLANYIDLARALLDDQEASTRYFYQQAAARIQAVQRLPDRSPWALYAEAEMRLQRAALWAKAGNYIACAQETRRACALLEENRRRFPHFALNRKSLAIVQALLGALPDEFRWAAEWLSGLRGSVLGGISELEALLVEGMAETLFFEEEIRIAIALLRLHLLEDKEGAWRALQSARWNARQNPLAAYSLAVVAARSGRNDEAIRLLEAAPEGEPFHPFWQRHYLLGVLKLNRLDADADQPLRRFARHFLGETGRWEACQKIAWHCLLHGDTSGYRTWTTRIAAARRPRSEQDHAAWREACEGPRPHPALLRARLLFDGGYYQRAYETLTQQPASHYTGDHRLEYTYRLARIAHALGRYDEAERHYRQTLEEGRLNPAYFACQAALQLGILYENTRKCAQAKTAYQTCLRLKPQQYRISLHAKAKAGLARLQKRC
ncbi:MAG: hypothetical protein RMJ33_04800 [Saprospiraceae bacterium]|nr:hypothetical protein [Saprospiraceae bacterium]